MFSTKNSACEDKTEENIVCSVGLSTSWITCTIKSVWILYGMLLNMNVCDVVWDSHPLKVKQRTIKLLHVITCSSIMYEPHNIKQAVKNKWRKTIYERR